MPQNFRYSGTHITEAGAMADVEPPPERTMLPDNNASPTRAKDHRAADMLADEEPKDSDCTGQALQEEIVPSRRMEQLGNPVGEKKFRGEPLRQGQRTASLVPPVVERGERHGKREYEQQVPHPAAHRQVNCREKESMRPDLKVAPRAPSLRQHLLGPRRAAKEYLLEQGGHATRPARSAAGQPMHPID
eukprot:CAMPEP_0203931894 /NCGR_PEP_ID=MMETSP0359-20131031/70391_1 /ASSEMBLY_ACC=CAM_ASM_000338 /TAXON_ID=268821 /ORGANISM="Scrippsiella Hangoei, Strain SHTV-5" /LENGTH=188 /DNA_ID=CAMNT_0050861289 /DNA_START=108 /DNA_END=675 /DNA_ORIENTATION=-